MVAVSVPTILKGEPAKLAILYGYGYGSSSGSGSGDGYGYGDGSGSGYGYGYGSKEYWLAAISCFAKKWPDDLRAKMDAAIKAGAQLAFWRSNSNGGL